MVGTSEYTPKGRLLGAELRDLRVKVGLTVRDLAARLGTSHVTISRYETGTRTPRPEDTARILATLGVTGSEYEELVDFARSAGDKNTFARTSNGPHKHLIDLSEFERSADSITDIAPNLIPGLLQTAAYARVIMQGLPPEEREVRVGLRMARRDVLTSKSAPRFNVVVKESALREPLGGHELMADQLRHIASLSMMDNITVRVLPRDLTHWTPAHDGAFVLFEFLKAPPIVHLEHFRAPAFLFDSKDVAAYKDAVQELNALALSPEESAERIASIMNDLEGIPCP